jgi:acyl transferase domain-containing protein
VGARLLASDLPAHTPALIPLAGAWIEDLRWLGRREPTLPLYSTVTGARIDALEPPHWARNLHDPVLFQPALEKLLDDGFDLFLEVGPHPVLGASIDAIADRAGRRVHTLATLRRDLGERRSTLEAVASLHVLGRSLDWAGIQPRGRVVALPTTPWDSRRCWLPDPVTPARPPDALHEIRWERSPLPGAGGDLSGRWILLGEGPLAGALTEAIQARGGEVLTRADPARSTVRAVIYVAPRGEDLQSIEAGCAELVATVQALATAPSARLILVTSGAVHDGTTLTQAPLWGLGRVIASEHPELRFASVDVGSPSDLGALVALLGHPEGARVEQSALRDGERWIPRLSALAAGDTPRRSPLRRDGTYLITGGLGEVGLRVARWMAEKGAGRVVLVGRSAPRAQAEEAVSAMERAGARVEIAPADVANEADLARVLATIDASSPPLRGVIHAAGVADSALLVELGRDRIGPALSAKIAGAVHLDRLTRGRPLDFFVLFSSLATWLGLPGQGTYAAANAFLDALARRRRGSGLPALSVGWAAWSGLGFASSPGVERALSHLARVGLRGFTPEEALSTLEALLSAGERAPAQVITLPRGEAAGDASPRWASLVSEPTSAEPQAPPARASLLAEADPARRLLDLVDHTRAMASTVLRIAPSEIGPDTPLGALGMDSFLAVELRRRLQDSLGLTLPATIAYRRPTVMDLAKHLTAALGEAPDSPEPAPARQIEAPGLAEALAEIEALGDADVRRILAEP